MSSPASTAASRKQSMNNKGLVKTAMTELFVNRDLTAIDRYWSPDYNGVDFFRKMIPTLPSNFKYEPGLVIEDGEFAMIHGRFVGWGDKTMIAADIFRVKDGKLVEHWDVIQEEVPASQTASGNAMFPIK